jgi:DNA-binding IscR family transcriptional regulator
MRSDSQFTVAIHTLILVEYYRDESITSDLVARSIGCNPVIVRNVFTKLNRAGILNPGMGRKKTELAVPADRITLRDVFAATQSLHIEHMFGMYDANPQCPVGPDIHRILTDRLGDARDSILKELEGTTIADLVSEIPPGRGLPPLHRE